MGDHSRSQQLNPLSFLVVILLLTLLVSHQALRVPQWQQALLYWPYRVKENNEWYRILSHALVHGDYTHLLVNAFVLWQFGSRLESFMQTPPVSAPFSMLYLGGIAFAAIPGMMKHHGNPSYRSLGASGAVSAVLIAYILHFPTAELLLFFVVPMPAFLAGILFFLYEHQMNKRSRGKIAHDAHLWGGIFGLLFTGVTEPQLFPEFAQAVWSYLPFSS